MPNNYALSPDPVNKPCNRSELWLANFERASSADCGKEDKHNIEKNSQENNIYADATDKRKVSSCNSAYIETVISK